MNNLQDVIIPESPRVLSKEQVSLQVPVASSNTPGVSSFYDEHFVVIDGHVRLKNGYLKQIVDTPIGNLKLNSITDDRGCVLQLLSDGKLLNEVLLDIEVEADVTTEEREVIPTKSQQDIVPVSADYLSKVIVKPIPDRYIIPSGGLTITENGSYPVVDKASVLVSVKNTEGVMDINGIIREYEVNAGATVNAGDFVEFINKFGSGEFNSASSNYISACKLDNNRVLVAYSDFGNSNYGTALVLKISDRIVHIGKEKIITNNITSYISVCTLTDSKVLVALKGETNTICNGYAVVLTIDDMIISINGSIQGFLSHNIAYISSCALTESTAIIVFADIVDNYMLTAIPLTINGSLIEFGNAVDVRVQTYEPSIATLTANKALVVYKYVDGTNYKFAGRLLTVQDNVLGFENETIISSSVGNSNHGSYSSVVALSKNKALAVYLNHASTYSVSLRAAPIDIVGTAILAGTQVSFGTQGDASTLIDSKTSTVALTDDKVLVVYQDGSNNDYNTAIVLTISDEGITAGGEIVLEEVKPSYVSAIAFSGTSALVLSHTGLFYDLSINGTGIIVNETTGGTYVQSATSNLHNVGVAKTSGTEGEIVKVYCVGAVSDEITDLTGTTWLLNKILTFPSEIAEYYIDFTAIDNYGDEINFVKLSLIPNGVAGFTYDLMQYVFVASDGSYGGRSVYSSTVGFDNDESRLVKITGGTDVTNPDLIAWLQENGKLQ